MTSETGSAGEVIAGAFTLKEQKAGTGREIRGRIRFNRVIGGKKKGEPL